MPSERQEVTRSADRPPGREEVPFELDQDDPEARAEGPDPTSTFLLLSRLLGRSEELASLAEALEAAIGELGPVAGGLAAHAAIRSAGEPAEPEVTSLGWWWSAGEPIAPLVEATERLLTDADADETVDDPLLRLAFGDDRWADGEVPTALAPSRARAAAAAGVRRAIAFSVRADGRLAAIVELFSEREEGPGPALRRAIELVRAWLDQVASRERARAAVGRAAERVREVGGRLEATAARLGELEERYALLCRGAEPGLWDWDLQEDRVVYSARFKALLGFDRTEFGDRPADWFDRLHPDDADRVELELLAHLDWQSPRFESEHRVLHADGDFRWVSASGVALRDDSGTAVRIAGSLTDITAFRSEDERTARDFMYHRLTGLPTRPLLLDRIRQAMRRRARRPDRVFAVLALELEGLQAATERVGTEATEELMLSLSRRVQNVERPGDTLAHTDEFQFGLLLEEVKTLSDAVAVAERVHAALSEPVPLGEEVVSLSPAIGLVLSRSSYDAPEELLRDAGIALRRARRNEVPVQVFDAATKAYAQSLGELEGDLRRAFDGRELFLEYQPVVSLSDGRITGVEALLRWTHPERGPIPPSEFLPVADEAGLLDEIGHWVVEHACRQMREWIEHHGLRFPPNIAVNVTEGQLFEKDFVARTVRAVETAGLEAKLLRLDVRESAFMKDGATAGRVLRALAQRGIRIAIDDFGTGYSSLSYLHRYPIGALKIDRAFVSGPRGAGHDWDVARTVIELARILELEVIAEGIETREQFLRLRTLGCQQAQGFYFSGPVSASRASKLIREGYPLDLEAVTL